MVKLKIKKKDIFILEIELDCYAIHVNIFSNSGLDHNENARDTLDAPVLASDLLNIMEESILTFRLFLKMDKKKSSHAMNLFKGHNQDASSLHQVQTSLDKVLSSETLFFSSSKSIWYFKLLSTRVSSWACLGKKIVGFLET